MIIESIAPTPPWLSGDPNPAHYPHWPKHSQHHKTKHAWAGIRRPSACYKPKRITAAATNRLHRGFLDEVVGAEAYTYGIIKYLVAHGHDEQTVCDFLLTVNEGLADGSFCPNRSVFARLLTQRYAEYVQDRTASAAPIERGELDDSDERDGVEDSDEQPNESNQLAAIKRASNKAELTNAYIKATTAPRYPLYEDELLKRVTAFAKGKAAGRTFQTNGSATADDVSQNIAEYVWQHLKDFRGRPESFYSWLNRISYAQACTAFNENLEESKLHEPLFVEVEEGSGDLEDNPALYRPDYPEMRRQLPDFIQGTDWDICEYIRLGFDYERIAKVLKITEQAVKNRVHQMRKKVQMAAAASPVN